MSVDGAGEMVSFSITGLDQGTYPPFVAGQTAWRFMLLARLASRFLIHLCGRLRSLGNCVVMSKVRMVCGIYQSNGLLICWTKWVSWMDSSRRGNVTVSQMV